MAARGPGPKKKKDGKIPANPSGEGGQKRGCKKDGKMPAKAPKQSKATGKGPASDKTDPPEVRFRADWIVSFFL